MTDRIEGFLRRIERLSVDDLTMLVLGPVDVEDRDRLLDRIDDAARGAGRLDEVDDAADRVRDAMVRAFSARGLEPTWFGLNWGRSMGRPEDRALLIQALEDAAMAAVVADLVPDEAAALSERFELIASMAGTAPTVNPDLNRGHRQVVRLALVVAGSSWIVVAWAGLVALVDELIDASTRWF
jgi:hypothetical protein